MQSYLILEKKRFRRNTRYSTGSLSGPENCYQSDIIYISHKDKEIIHEDGLHGAPDLVIDLLSPSTENYDLLDKQKVYGRSGVLDRES